MELKTASQKNCLARLASRLFEMFHLSKITFGLGQTNIIFQATICKVDKKADILTTRL